MIIELPIPATFLQWTWLGIGLTFGRAFGKQLDQNIQNSAWFKELEPWQQWFAKCLLDFLHHWYIGALIMLYVARVEFFWFGYGLLLDDLPDIPRRLRKLLKYFGKQEVEPQK